MLLSTFIRFIPVSLWYTVIFILSSIPGNQISSPVPDVIPHFIVYFIFGIALVYGIYGAGTGGWRLYFSIGFVAAISDEFHQSFVPGRYFTISDILYDLMGLTAAFFLFKGLKKKIFRADSND